MTATMRSLVFVALSAVAVGCVSAATVEVETGRLDGQLAEARQNAITCAPAELAEAEARIAFCRHESSMGKALEAEQHLERARDLVAVVLKKSTGSGCESDRDGDGIADTVDRCPDIPEDFDNEDDEDGCPDYDRDGDSVPDDRDRCPDQPEDKDGFQDQDGCPEFDNDRDGLPDTSDQCPNEAEDFDGFQDLDGCPDLDNDGDDVPDLEDRCPNQPGSPMAGGCPDTYKHILFRGKQIELKRAVFFDKRTGALQARSNIVLKEIASALKSNPKVKLRIEGHTDSEGDNKANQRASEKVAKAVKRYLVGQGVSAKRLQAVGFGEDRPIDENDTEEGRATNRRVEFHIID